MDDAKTRIRQRIARLLDDRGKTQRALARYLGHGDQWASNLLNGRFALSLDDLDRTAHFLNVPPSELVRRSEDAWELSPTEMRLVRAVRMLPVAIRDHLVTLADYLIGATPDEVELLKRVRELDAEELARIEHWIDVQLLARNSRLRTASPADLAVTGPLPDAPTPRTRTPHAPGRLRLPRTRRATLANDDAEDD